ncbi:MAG: hypothetical protein ACRDGJ_11700, partial [Candidatus Limnocylindria bacterium]
LGAGGIVAGLAILAAFVIEIPQPLVAPRIILFNLGCIGVVLAVHRRQASVAPVIALAGAVPAVLANLWYLVMVVLAIDRPDPVFGGDFGLVFFWAGMALWLADAWFGIMTLRLGAVTRWGALAVGIGSLLTMLGIDRLGLVSEANPTIFNALATGGIVILSVGWILLGVDVARRRTSTTD